MKIHIISDLHLEFSGYDVQALEADVIILGGDIGTGMRGIQWAAQLLRTTEAHIVYVAGNHEFYRQDINTLRDAMRKYCSAPEGWSGDSSQHRLHFLDNSEAVIKGVRVLGCTLWSDFNMFGTPEKSMEDARRGLNDFHLIRHHNHMFKPFDATKLHVESVAWLTWKLMSEQFDGKTVVVTHHLPSMKSVADRYMEDRLSPCFASHLDHLLGYSELWIHGHAHDSFDYDVGGTRVICNPRGYSRSHVNENAAFDPKLMVEI
jgi:predicted phosphodiesterase